MAKARAQTTRRKAEPEAGRSPLDEFVRHQTKAIEETGRALASLLPADFRTHVSNAANESRAGFEAVLDGVLDSLECGLEKLRGSHAEEPGKEKVKVDVE